MSHKSPIIPVKTYAPVIHASKVSELPTPDIRIKTLEIQKDALATEIAIAKDRIRRMREVIENEVKYWESGLQSGDWESIDAVRRRLSRLKGALQYPGIRGFGNDEEL